MKIKRTHGSHRCKHHWEKSTDVNHMYFYDFCIVSPNQFILLSCKQGGRRDLGGMLKLSLRVGTSLLA